MRSAASKRLVPLGEIPSLRTLTLPQKILYSKYAMSFPARKSIVFFIASSLLSILLLIISPAVISSSSLAQTSQSPALQPVQQGLGEIRPNQYNTPNLNPDVPRNQHTFAQAATIEVISSIFCVITGIDPINPSQGCLDVDPQTKKLGLRPPQNGEPKIGGLIGYIPGMFSIVFTPPASSEQYIRYLANNFGIVKPAFAQSSNGFDSLGPLQPLWGASRNVTYLLFVLVFIFIGLGIMLRVKIDPRTVMTLQNQIPRVIIGILLITFSYAIAGLMIDAMWLITYAGINTITTSGLAKNTNPTTTGCSPNLTLQQRATQNLLTIPFNFGDQVLKQECHWYAGGLTQIALGVSGAVGSIIEDLVDTLISGAPVGDCITWSGWIPTGISLENCLLGAVGTFLGFLARILALLIVILALLWSFLRIWYSLLRAYVMIIIYVITAPLWIVVGMLPPGKDGKRPLGFEKWFFRMFAHLAVFPATAALLVVASIMANLFRDPATSGAYFVPPLVGQQNMQSFGWLIAFAFVLMAPELLDIIVQNLHAMSQGGALATKSVAAQVASGAALPKGAGKGVWKAATYVNPYTGEATGPLAAWAVGKGTPDTSFRKKYIAPVAKHFFHVDMDRTEGKKNT